MSPSGFKIIPATIEDRKEIFQFLCKEFFQDEPLNKMLTNKYPDLPLMEFEEIRSLQSLSANLSLKVISEANCELVGVALFILMTRNDKSITNNFNNKRKCIIIDLLKKVSGNIWDYIPKQFDKAADFSVLSIAKKYHNQGIATVLMKEVKEHLKKQGIDVLIVECSSEFTAKLCEKEKMNFISSFPYNEYRNDDGDFVFVPEPPHTHLKVYYQIL